MLNEGLTGTWLRNVPSTMSKDGKVSGHPPAIQDLTQVPPLDLRRLLAVLWYGKMILVCTFGFAVWGGGYYAFHMSQPRFAAEATLRVDLARSDDLRQVD